jgi:HEAT repeat protein
MAVTMQQVLAQIDKDEPDYERAAKLGKGALPHLRKIIEADDPMLASKATYAASLIGGADAIELLGQAANRKEPEVRVAAAHALGNTSDAPPQLLEKLLGDKDAGVRKLALRTVGQHRVKGLESKVATIAKRDPEEFIRTAAADTNRKLKT